MAHYLFAKHCEEINVNLCRRNLLNRGAGGGNGIISKDIHVMSGEVESGEESGLQTQNTQIRLGRSYQDMLYEGMM